MKVAFYTLGCKVNQNETGAMQQLFCENGFTLAQGDETADVYIVNSCTVTSGGDKRRHAPSRRPILSQVPLPASSWSRMYCVLSKRANASLTSFLTARRRRLRSFPWSKWPVTRAPL